MINRDKGQIKVGRSGSTVIGDDPKLLTETRNYFGGTNKTKTRNYF